MRRTGRTDGRKGTGAGARTHTLLPLISPFKLDEDEWEAIIEGEQLMFGRGHNPKDVMCPRCGGELYRVEGPDTVAVYCPTKGCTYAHHVQREVVDDE